MDRHTPGRSFSGARQSGLERIVSLIGDADPIDRTKYDWLTRSQQHEAARPEPEVPPIGHRIVGHHRTNRRRGVDVECGDPQCGIRRIDGLSGGRLKDGRGQNTHNKSGEHGESTTKRNSEMPALVPIAFSPFAELQVSSVRAREKMERAKGFEPSTLTLAT